MAGQSKYKRRADGNYQRSITVGRKPDGKPIRKTIYAKTIKELELRAAEYEQKLKHGTLSRNEKMTFAELAAVWVENYTPDVSERTRKEYAALLRNHLNPIIGGYRLIDLKKHDLQSILNALAEGGMAHSTMTKVKIVAVAVLELAMDNDILMRNVFAKVEVPDAEAEERQPLTDQQKHVLMTAWQGHRMGLPALLMMYCGLRRGELLALTWRDIDLAAKTVTVNKAVFYSGNAAEVKLPKSKAGIRTVPIPDALVDALRVRRRASTLVCPAVTTGGMMSSTAFNRAWDSFQHHLNISAGGRDASRTNPKVIAVEPFTAHQLRHTYATMLYDAGVDVLTAQRLLGHADVQTTMRVYTHLSKQKEQQSIAALNAHIGAAFH